MSTQTPNFNPMELMNNSSKSETSRISSESKILLEMLQMAQSVGMKQRGPIGKKEVDISDLVEVFQSKDLSLTEDIQKTVVIEARKFYDQRCQVSYQKNLDQYFPQIIENRLFDDLCKIFFFTKEKLDKKQAKKTESKTIFLLNDCCNMDKCPKIVYQEYLLEALRKVMKKV